MGGVDGSPPEHLHLGVVEFAPRGPETRQSYDNSPGLFSRLSDLAGSDSGHSAVARPRVIPNWASRRRVPQLPLHPLTLPGVGWAGPPLPILHRARNAYLQVVMSTGNELDVAGDRQSGRFEVGPFCVALVSPALEETDPTPVPLLRRVPRCPAMPLRLFLPLSPAASQVHRR